MQKLYGYLVDNGNVRALDTYPPEHLAIFSRDALKKIQAGDASWEGMVPADVAKVIKEQRFLGYRPHVAEADGHPREQVSGSA